MDNKKALLRYVVLDRCFKSRFKKYYKEDLVEEIEKETDIVISTRQVTIDIENMMSFIPIELSVELIKYTDDANNGKVYWRYSDLEFSILSQLVSQEDKEMINVALSVLSNYGGLPHFEWIQETIAGVRDKLGMDGEFKEVIAFDTNMRLKGLKFLTPMYEAISSQTVLEVDYKDFRGNSKNYFFHPHFIKQYDNSWFVYGKGEHEEEEHDPWITPLDRIISLKKTNRKYVDSDRDWHEFFFDKVGIREEGEEETVVKLAVDDFSAKYVEVKPLHGTQVEVESTDNRYTIEVTLKPNYEFKSLVLSFGEYIEVLEPESLRSEMKKRTELMHKNYG